MCLFQEHKYEEEVSEVMKGPMVEARPHVLETSPRLTRDSGGDERVAGAHVGC